MIWYLNLENLEIISAALCGLHAECCININNDVFLKVMEGNAIQPLNIEVLSSL